MSGLQNIMFYILTARLILRVVSIQIRANESVSFALTYWNTLYFQVARQLHAILFINGELKKKHWTLLLCAILMIY